MRGWHGLLFCLTACGRLGFDPRTTADAVPGTSDGAADSMIGSDGMLASPVTQLQSTTAMASNGTQTFTLPNPTTTGSIIVATFGLNSAGVLTLPMGWFLPAESSINGACVSGIATEASGVAGRQSFTFTIALNAPTAFQRSEWSGVDLTSPFDGIGMGGSSFSMLALSISTSGATGLPGELAIGTFCEDVQAPTFTVGSGWTELGQAPGASATPSLFTEYQVNAPIGVVTATGSSSLVAKYAATVLTFRPK